MSNVWDPNIKTDDNKIGYGCATMPINTTGNAAHPKMTFGANVDLCIVNPEVKSEVPEIINKNNVKRVHFWIDPPPTTPVR